MPTLVLKSDAQERKAPEHNALSTSFLTWQQRKEAHNPRQCTVSKTGEIPSYIGRNISHKAVKCSMK